MRKLYLEAGHADVIGLDPGAVTKDTNGVQITEGHITFQFEEAVANAYESLGGTVVRDIKSNALVQTLKKLKNLIGIKDAVVSFHLDAASDPHAHGHALIIPEKANTQEILLAQAISRILTEAGSTARQMLVPSQTPHKRLGWLEQPGICILVELGFLTNEADRLRVTTLMTSLAGQIAYEISHI